MVITEDISDENKVDSLMNGMGRAPYDLAVLLKVEGAAYGLKITLPGIFKDNLGKVCAAVCPECGYIV